MARAIEYADPKKINHGRRRTTVIAGGPAQPDYTGMTGWEKENAKAEYEVKRKAYADQCRRKRLKGNVELDSAAVARCEVHRLSASDSQGRIAETWPHCSIELHGETGDAEKDRGCGIVGRIAL